MKIIVAAETYSGENRLKVAQWIAFSLADINRVATAITHADILAGFLCRVKGMM